MPPGPRIAKEPTSPKPDRLFSGATSSSRPITFVATTLTVPSSTTIRMVHHGKHHNSALCIIANRSLIPRILAVLREQRPYELQDFEGQSITKAEARELAEKWKVPEEVRKRLRNKTTLAQERWEAPPSVTSEPKAPRNGRPSQPAHPNPETLSLTKDQLKILVFKSLEQMLNSGGNVEEIRLRLREEAANIFKERA